MSKIGRYVFSMQEQEHLKVRSFNCMMKQKESRENMVKKFDSNHEFYKRYFQEGKQEAPF